MRLIGKNGRVPDPAALLAAARLLADPNATGAAWPDDARLRRAVSTAYYAVFHTVLRAAADRFMGPHEQASPGYAILYRGFQHGEMREACKMLRRSTLPPKYSRALRRATVSQALRDFAGAFAELQDERHRADYDPVASFLPSEVATILLSAENAIDSFAKIPPYERADVLALLLAGARA